MGPSLIFDKSTLQGLNPDESVWLEHFYINNITPLFFVETLADLELEMKKGRTPEDIVGNLAYKTPEMAKVNAYHRNLIQSELLYDDCIIEMSGRPVLPGGRTVVSDGKIGIIFDESPENEAFKRWQKSEFLEIERSIAKTWRLSLNEINTEQNFNNAKIFFNILNKSKTLDDLKTNIDRILDVPKNEEILKNSLYIMNISDSAHDSIIKKFRESKFQTIKEIFPYFAYVLSVDLFLYFGSDNNLFSFLPHSATHKVDMAYFYYLPFCNIFTSNDKLHVALSKYFMRQDQAFINGSDLKNELKRLDEYYSKFSEEVKARGLFSLAPCPPDEIDSLTVKMWDKYMSKDWREIKNRIRKFDGSDKINPEANKVILDKIKEMMQKSKTVEDGALHNSDDADSIIIRHMVKAKKGKWTKFPPEVLKSKPLMED